jgi:hypothetical protein
MPLMPACIHKLAARLAAQVPPGHSADMPAARAASPWGWPTELQAGVVTRSQALASGVTDKIIAAHLRRGRWQRLQRGVYATFSGTPSRECLLWAAVLRAGPRSVLSHQTAAQLWRLSAAEPARIHITMPMGSPAPLVPGVIMHYSARVLQERHPVLAPPRTTVEATALDLASGSASAEDAIAWVLTAIASRQTTSERVAAALRARRRMRWRTAILLALDPLSSGVHSILEYRFVNRVERPHGLPEGTRQRLVLRGQRRQYSDVAYDDYTTIVELDGRVAHPERSRHLDAERDNANAADGWITLRYGWTEVSQRSCEVAAQLGSALRRRGWPGSLRRCGPACRLPEAELTGAAPPGLA